MSGKGRASVFEDSEEIDISAFSPKPSQPKTEAQPTLEQVRAISEAANFPSRESAKPPAAKTLKREPRRYRTGRNVQFNAKAAQSSIDRFYALCDGNGWV